MFTQHGQPLDEVAEDLKGGRTSADDHRRAEGGHRHARCGKFSLDLTAGTQVGAQVGAHLAKAAQVDDPRHPRPGRSTGEAGRQLPIAGGIFTAGRLHGMNEVIGRRGAGHLAAEDVLIGEVAGDDLHGRMRPPRSLVEFPGCTHEASNTVASLQEGGHESAPDVACCPGDKNGLLVGVLAHRGAVENFSAGHLIRWSYTGRRDCFRVEGNACTLIGTARHGQ